MEFERAIFRVYERCLEGLRDDDNEAVNSKSCRAFELLSLGGAFFFLLTLIFLHLNFVGRPGCLPILLNERALAMNLTSSRLGKDQILQVNVDRRFAPNVDNSGSDSLKSYDDSNLDDGGRRRLLLRGKTANDIPLSSWNLGGSNSRNQRISNRKNGIRNYLSGFQGLVSNTFSVGGYILSTFSGLSLKSSRPSLLENDTIPPTSLPSASPSIATNVTNSTSHHKFVRTYDFEFAYDVGILALTDEILDTHKFEIVEVTLSGNRCFGPSILQDLLPLGGIDTIIMNAIMFTTGKGGTLVSSSGDYYSWYNEDIKPYTTIAGWLGFKLNVLLSSLFAFFFLSSITALLVRVLISSGVVLLFPVLWGLQFFGVQVISARIISMSYPWIGLPMEMFRANHQSSVPFILSHITRVIIYYSLYEATQLAFSEWFYGQGRPSQRELWLFAIMMLWEYYSMIYVRSNNSIRLFPRASLALFLLYHFYLFSSPSGFHLLALLVLFLFLTALMIFCVRKFEFDAFYRGVVNIDQPRMLQNNLPWPAWTVALAPDYTLFMPVTVRSASAYQNNIPPLTAPAAQNAPANTVEEAGSGNDGGATISPTTLGSTNIGTGSSTNTIGSNNSQHSTDRGSGLLTGTGTGTGGESQSTGRYQQAAPHGDIELQTLSSSPPDRPGFKSNPKDGARNPPSRMRISGGVGGEYKYSGISPAVEYGDSGEEDLEEEYKREKKDQTLSSGKGRMRPALASSLGLGLGSGSGSRVSGSKGSYSRVGEDRQDDISEGHHL